MYTTRAVIVSALVGIARVQAQYSAAAPPYPMVASDSMLASSTATAYGSLSTASGSPPMAESSMQSGMAGTVATHVVQVGGTNLAFSPNSIVAQAGDLVQFQFHTKNHSLVQSNFANPCIPIQNIQPNVTDAFFSGFMPNNSTFGSTSNVPTYTIRVKDTKPIWFYCSQAKHCQAGMVGAINAPTSGNKTLSAFVALAAMAPETLSPGQSAGSGTQNTPTSPSSPPGSGSGTGSSSGGSASGSSTAPNPAQISTNTAAGLSSQSFFGLAAAALAAIAML